MAARVLAAEFERPLLAKEKELVDLFYALRSFILELCPESNELLYHTHALTDLFSTSAKMGDGFCMIPIYTKHLNLGFNKGALLSDPKGLLKGTGKLIRHIPISTEKDFRNSAIRLLIEEAYQLALEDGGKEVAEKALVISKIKKVK